MENGKKLLVFVDDDPGVLRALRRLVSQKDAVIFLAQNLEEARQVFSSIPEKACVHLVTDGSLGDCSCCEVLDAAQQMLGSRLGFRAIFSGSREFKSVAESFGAEFIDKATETDRIREFLRKCVA